jgi:hypothetical protein
MIAHCCRFWMATKLAIAACGNEVDSRIVVQVAAWLVLRCLALVQMLL